MPDKKTMQARYIGGFLICGYQTFAPSKNIRMLGPNTVIFAQKYAILDNLRPCPLIWCPDGWLVGYGAQAALTIERLPTF